MSGAIGGGQSSQESSSTSGVARQYKEPLSADAYGRSQQLGAASQAAYNSPFGYFQGQSGAQMLGLDPKTGLPGSFGGYLGTVAQDMYAKASAGGSFRGQNSPENTSNIVGSAIQGLGAQALPYVSQFAQMAATLPEQMQSQRLGYLQAAGANDAALLGGTSNYNGSAWNLNMSGGIGKA